MQLNNLITKFAKKRVIIPLAIILFLGICYIYNLNAHRVRYETTKLKKCTITQVVEASGTINPVNTVSVGSTVSGLMKEIYVDYNSEVKKGQLLSLIHI